MRSPEYEYEVVPFVGQVKGNPMSSENADAVASQLQGLINDGSTDGWEYYRIDQVHAEVRPGCLGFLTGSQVEAMPVDQVIFRRRVD